MSNVSVNHRCTLSGALVLSVLLVSALSTFAQRKPERVRFRRGHSEAMLRGRIPGFESRDYLVAAKAGQVMTLKLTSSNPFTNFVVYSINGRPTDMNETTEWSEKLSESGDYLVRVFMMRAGARRKGAVANYTLKISVQ